eukprot:SAG11_NODE_1998_length_3943_cov_6.764828_5_plen_165_part_00
MYLSPLLVSADVLRMWYQRIDRTDRLKAQLALCWAIASQRVIAAIWCDKQRICMGNAQSLKSTDDTAQHKSTNIQSNAYIRTTQIYQHTVKCIHTYACTHISLQPMHCIGAHLQRLSVCQISKPAAMRPVPHRHQEEIGLNFSGHQRTDLCTKICIQTHRTGAV